MPYYLQCLIASVIALFINFGLRKYIVVEDIMGSSHLSPVKEYRFIIYMRLKTKLYN